MDGTATQALQLACTAGGGDVAALALLLVKRRLSVDTERERVVRRLEKLGWPAVRQRLAQTFVLLGYEVEEIEDDPRAIIDLILSDDLGYTYVHCRRWRQQDVLAEDVHQLRAAMKVLGIQRGMWISTGTFSDFAERLAGQAGISLIDYVKLEHLLGWAEPSPN